MGFIKQRDLQEMQTRIVSDSPRCGKCGLHSTCISPRMSMTGEGKKRIFILSEAPGEQEDKCNQQLVGRAGRTLQRSLSAIGIKLHADCWKLNAVNCRPPQNRTPTDLEIDCCLPYVIDAIRKTRPRVILLLGSIAVRSFMHYRMPNNDDPGGISRWRGFTIPDYEFNAWVCPIFHLSFVDRQNDKLTDVIFSQDLKVAMSCLEYALPPQLIPKIQHKSTADALEVLDSFIESGQHSLVSIDYETTGLKPHTKGHQIVSCGISDYESGNTCSFLVTNRLRAKLREFMCASFIGKIAADIKFEERWTREYIRTKTASWIWDTQLAAHLLDNRKRIVGLKFQVFVNYGEPDYASHIEKYMKSASNEVGANSFNRMRSCPVFDNLEYVGCDAFWEMRLAVDQMKMFGIIDPLDYARRHAYDG
jgi:uracil-DNA glycosylase family 4